jgi:signal transduction histidine kinase
MLSTEFQQFYGRLPEPMLLLSPDGEILAVNRSAAELIGRSDLQGTKFTELANDPEPKVSRFLLLCRRSSELLPGAVEIRRGDGTPLPCRVEGALAGADSTTLLRLFPKQGATSRFVVLNERIAALNKEIGERVRAEVALAASNEALRRANADLEQFAYSASHDLREPLRMVALYSDLLRRRYQGRIDAKADEYIGFTVEGAKRMEALVADLLAYTRAVAGAEESPQTPTSAASALDAALKNLSTAIQESGAVVHRGPLPELSMHEVHLMQLFQNLIGNAIKYRGEHSPEILITADIDGSRWRISVHDNGIGIAPEYTDRIFGLFKRLHTTEQYSGTGIGLAICQKIVHRYGGRIWVESGGEGRGCTFRFTAPGPELGSSASGT